MSRSRLGWQMLRLVFSIGLVALVASQVDLGQMARVLAQADLWLVTLAWFMALAGWVVASYKWSLLLRALGTRVPLRVLVGLNLVGLFYGLFLPGQLGGEVVKGIKLARYGVDGATTTVSIGMDRLTGVVALALLAVGGLAFAPETAISSAMKLAALSALAVSLAPLAILAVSSWFWGGVRVPGWMVAWKPVRLAVGVAGMLVTAFLQYRQSPGTILWALVWSVVNQVMMVVLNACAAAALGLDVPLMGLAWIVCLTSILHIMPLSIAGLGVREGAYVLMLRGYGVESAEGLLLALLVFGIIVAQGLLGGLIEVATGFGLRRAVPAPEGDSPAAVPPTPARRS